MKKILLILTLCVCAGNTQAQFADKDTLIKFINKWIRNSAVDAFTNLRLNTALIGLVNQSDSNGILSLTAPNDSTLRLVTKGRDTFQVVIRGTGGSGGGSGTVGSGNQYQLAYYNANGTAVIGLTTITGSRALASDANGLPVASTTTASELAFVSGVTSAIQTQLNGKVNISDTTSMLSPYARKSQVADSLTLIRNAKKWPAEAPIGTIYNKQAWNSLHDFTISSTGTVSLALSSGFVNYSVSSISWENYTRLLYTRPTILSNWTIEVIFKMNTAPGSGTVGFGLGTKKYINQNADIMCYVNTTNSGSGTLSITRADGTGSFATGSSSTINQNDIVRLRVTFADSSITFYAKNLTTGAAEGSVSYSASLISTNAPISAIANWGLIGHSSTSCTWQVQSIKITSETKRNANLVVVGDSKTQGAFADSFTGRFGTKLGITYPSSIIYSSGGATAGDFINLREEITYLNGVQYLIALGSNSIRGSTSVDQTVKELRTLYTWMKGGGATVKLIMMPEDSTGGPTGGGVGLTALKNAMASEFGSDYIDVWTGLSTSNVLKSMYNSGDGVHLNQAANDYIATTVAGSGGFATRPLNMIAPFRVSDNNVKVFGDSVFAYTTEKALNYVNHTDIAGNSVPGIFQDNGTVAGVSPTPMIPIPGMQFNVTGFLGVNGQGGIVFSGRDGALTDALFSLYAGTGFFKLFHNPSNKDVFSVNDSGRVSIGNDAIGASSPARLYISGNASGAAEYEPMKIGVGPLTSLPGKHAWEYTGRHWTLTDSTATRDTIAMRAWVRTLASGSTPALTSNYIGYGISGALSGTSSYQFDGTTVLQENSGAKHSITNTATLGSTTGGIFNLFTKSLPTAQNDRLGAINFGSRDGSTNENFGITFEALANAAWTAGSAEQAYARILTNSSGTQNEVMRWTANIRVGVRTTTIPSILTIGAGNSSENPLALTAGTRMTTPTNGSFAWETGGPVLFARASNTYTRVTMFNDATPTAGYMLVGNGTDFTVGDPFPIVSVSSTGTTTLAATAKATTIKVDATSGAVTVTVTPNHTGQIFNIKRMDNSVNTITVQMTSGTIDGAASKTVVTQYSTLQIQWDGTNAIIL